MTTNRHFVRVALIAALSFAAATLYAATVSTNDAAIAAKTWVDLGRSMGKIPSGRAVASVETLEDSSTGARLLVAKFEGGGFVVMSADDLVDPVISFSPTGDGIDTSDANPYWALLRGDIAAREAAAGVSRKTTSTRTQLASSFSISSSSQTSSQRKWAELLGTASSSSPTRLSASYPADTISDIRVDSFVDSRWSQDTHNNCTDGNNCYNYYTPNNYVCGCVATAGAQIMRYYQYPTASVEPKTYECSVSGVATNYTMRGGTYDWSLMPLVPANGVSETQCQAIGKLTYDVGVSVRMDWGDGNSSAPGYDLSTSLVEAFGYANAVPAMYVEEDNKYPYSIEEVKKVVIPNCDARCPMLMSISGAGGHAVLVDGYGYSDGDFCMHVNLGWCGSGDAWYCPPDFDTGDYHFTIIDGFVFNVFTNSTGSILSGRVLDSSGAPISSAAVTLKSGTSTIATTTTDANGIYAFIAEPGTYTVYGSSSGQSAYADAEVLQTVGTELTGDGRYYYTTAVIGNSYDNDIILTGVASVVAPVFTPESCTFYPSTNVTITCSDSEATIYYTTNGSTPTESSTQYSGPIIVEDTTTIKARAFKSGCNPSPTVGMTYTYDSAAGAPKGDYFANPIDISGASGSYVINDNADYTIEDDEPLHTLNGGSYFSQYRSAWYKWTAPGTGTMTFKTSCSGGGYVYSTYIAVYTNDTLSSIVRLEFATEYDSNYVTSLSIDVEQGTTYRIAGVMGYDGSGRFTFTWSGDLVVAQSPYEEWASGNGVGSADAVVNGVANIFRYIFDKPTESFSTVSEISIGSSGVVLTLPTIVNTNGVTLTMLSTTNLTDWTSSAVTERTVTVDSSGNVTFEDADPSRFYRLKAALSE